MADPYENAKARVGKKASKDFPQRGLVFDPGRDRR
jgi:hypothetical protein